MIGLVMGISFQKRNVCGKGDAERGSEGPARRDRQGGDPQQSFHGRTSMASPGRPSARLTHGLRWVPGTGLFVFEKRSPWPKGV